MKNKNAFTLIEGLIGLAIIAILCALIIAIFEQTTKKSKSIKGNHPIQEEIQKPKNAFQIGDTVYIDGMDTTGRINLLWKMNCFGDNVVAADLIVKGTNGTLYILEKINPALFKKVQTVEN